MAEQALIKLGIIDDASQLNEKYTEKGDTRLLVACREGNFQHLQLLIQAKADIDARNYGGASSVFLATQNGQADCLKYLIAAKADFNLPTKGLATPVFIAAQKGHIECLQILIQAGGDVNAAKVQTSPVLMSGSTGLSDQFRSLLTSGVTVNTAAVVEAGSVDTSVHSESSKDLQAPKGEDAVSPVFIAAQENKPEAIRILAAAGAVLDRPTNGGVTAVAIAAGAGNHECIRELALAGANVNTVTFNGFTPLLLACHKGCALTTRILIEAGCNLNTPSNDGLTPICLAAQQGQMACVKELLRAGASTEIKYKSKSAKRLAGGNGHKAVESLLSDFKKGKITRATVPP